SPESLLAREIVTTALLEDLSHEENPWVLLDAIRQGLEDGRIEVSQRQKFYEQFRLLVATCPRAEEDALLASGAPVFQYRMATAREEISKLRLENAEVTRIRPGL